MFIIETRTPEIVTDTTDETGAPIRSQSGPWTMDGLGDPQCYTFTSREEADRCAASLPDRGPDWAAYEYRVREV